MTFLFSAAVLSAGPTEAPIQLGLQSWTCRRLSFDELVQFADEQHLKYVQLCEAHIDPFSSPEVIRAKRSQLERHGLVAYAYGVAMLSHDRAKNRRLFEFARLLGLQILVVDFDRPDAWDELEGAVKEFNIKVAIHNHGPGSFHPNPLAYQREFEGRDPRLGLCLDIGLLTAAGCDAAEVFRQCHHRVLDMHFKDKRPRGPNGQWVDTLLGQGATHYDNLFAAMVAVRWHGVMAIETDDSGFAAAPGPFVTAARAFFAAKLPTQP